MRADLIRIGNSKGVRIPKAVLDEYGFGQRAKMRVEAGSLILSPVKAARVAGPRRSKPWRSRGTMRLCFPTSSSTALTGPSGSGDLPPTVRGVAGLS